MVPNAQENVEDIAESAKLGRDVRPHGPYRVLFGNSQLEYRPAIIPDPVPTGRQLLEAAAALPVEEHLVFQLLRSGLLEELRPDETTDLRKNGVERFLVFRNDRSFRFELDGRVFEWGGALISGLTLKKLAKVDLTTYGVWLEVRGAEDQPIPDNKLISLESPGIERFFTGIVRTTEG
jgi:Multiubiquitin